MADLFPGMPNIPGFVAQAFTILTQDAVAAFDGVRPQWGIYKGGSPVVICETVASFEMRKDYQISDFPVEQGAFASYNKVELPRTVRLTFASGGSDEARRALIDSIEAIIGTTDLYSATTPEKSYINMNVNHAEYNRKATSGLGLLKIDVWMEEVRIVNAAQVTTAGVAATPPAQNAPGNTAEPGGANPVADGTVQPLTPQILQDHAAEFQIPGFVPDPTDSGFEGIRPLTIHPKSN